MCMMAKTKNLITDGIKAERNSGMVRGEYLVSSSRCFANCADQEEAEESNFAHPYWAILARSLSH